MRTADCDDELLGARVEIYGINHEVEDRITVHPVNGIAGIIEATPELPLKVRLVPKRRDLPIVELYDLVTDKNSRRTGYRIIVLICTNKALYLFAVKYNAFATCS